MRTTRKLVSDLQVGDEVKGFGIITHISSNMKRVDSRGVTRIGSTVHVWPSDAEVTVVVPQPQIGDHVTTRAATSRVGELIAMHGVYGWVTWHDGMCLTTHYLEELVKAD
jgi:hypothetical protein